ncbi:MAG: ATP-binding protein, partial [Xanthomonadales bacterium]|nr:ATP-binding protein [Xanthomonadales bacterium]
GYPLSPALTQRVVSYLNYFRLFIALALSGAFLADVLVEGENLNNASLPGAVLFAYLLFSFYFVLAARRPDESFYHLALQSLVLDVVLITLLLHAFDGLAVLLVFVGAAAGIILPVRLALFIASLAALALLSEPFLAGLAGVENPGKFMTAGFYGLSVIVITILTHLLGQWARDFRVLAERQAQTVLRLERVNELIIRRLRSGVLAVSPDGEIKMMNESAWYLLGSPPPNERSLSKLSPELRIALQQWNRDPRKDPATLALNATQAQVVPKFVALPGGREISTIIFLEDNDVVSQRALEMSAVSLAKLSTSIAHEIRNPLAAVSHAADLLEEDERLDAGQQRLVDIIRNQSRRMNGIIENILQMSRREKSQVELIALPEWLRELLAEFHAVYSVTPFNLVIEPGAEDTTVLFDRSQLHQVLWKLMENALQHLGDENEQPRLFLRLSAGANPGYCVLSVEDNGTGIAEDRIGQIFEPFFTTRKDGTGLGLYIARQLCEANQAELTVESVFGEGTSFRIRMSLATNARTSGSDIERMRVQARGSA